MADLRGPRFWGLPVRGGAITGRFGDWYGGYQHRGIDIGVPEGTPIRNPGPEAEVLQVYTPATSTFGNAPVLDYGEGYEWRYAVFAHASEVEVEAGQRVGRWARLGRTGNTGLSTGPHLHWQVSRSPSFPRVLAESVDPAALMEDPGLVKEVEDLYLALFAHPLELGAMLAGEEAREDIVAKAMARAQMIIRGEPEGEPYVSPFWKLDEHVSLPRHGGAAPLEHTHEPGQSPASPDRVPAHRHEPGEVIRDE